MPNQNYQTEYLIAVLQDRIKVEEAYTALEKEGLPLQQITILGKGYKSADEFGLINPNQSAKKQALSLAVLLIPFGFFAGVVFSIQTDLHTFSAWAGETGNHIVGGLLGAASGGLGSIFVGGCVGLSYGSGDALPYRNRLNEGKYLLIVQGSISLKNQANQILQRFEPENIQGYTIN
jgi:hypothetical protein